MDPTRPSAPSVVDRRPASVRTDRRRPHAHRLRQADDLSRARSPAAARRTRCSTARTICCNEGVDVVVGLVETHGRADTTAKLAGLDVLARLPQRRAGSRGDLSAAAGSRADRRTRAHQRTRQPVPETLRRCASRSCGKGSRSSRRSTFNISKGLGDAVERLTGTHVRETLPDTILELADDVIFVDVTPEVLRERLRDGKIYPRERIDSALANFFRVGKPRGAARVDRSRTDARPASTPSSRRRSPASFSACGRANATCADRTDGAAGDPLVRCAGGGARCDAGRDARSRRDRTLQKATRTARGQWLPIEEAAIPRPALVATRQRTRHDRRRVAARQAAAVHAAVVRQPSAARGRARTDRPRPALTRCADVTLARVERAVEGEYVDVRFAEDAERAAEEWASTIALTAAGVMWRASATRGICQAAPSGEMSGSMPLPLEVTRSIGGSPAACGIRFLQGGDRRFGRVDELLRRRPEVRSAGRRRVVALARGRGPALEILRLRPELADDLRTDDFAVHLDERSVRLMREESDSRPVMTSG